MSIMPTLQIHKGASEARSAKAEGLLEPSLPLVRPRMGNLPQRGGLADSGALQLKEEHRGTHPGNTRVLHQLLKRCW